MKNTTIIKKVLAGMLSAALSITAFTLTASAAWKTTENGKQWIQSDGTVAKSKWLTTKSGAKYYIKSNGYMATGFLNLSKNGVKNRYYFNDGGVMQTGWQYVNKKYYYFDTKTGAAYTGKQKIGNYTYNFDSKGVWDGKVYSGSKDVTSKVDIAKLTGISTKTTAKKQNTVIIAGEEYSTSLKELLINKEGVTDKDLENLKYMTNLRTLQIVPGATKLGGSSICYEYTDVKQIAYDDSCTRWSCPMYTYEYTVNTRNTSIAITNLDFCKYMPKLEYIQVAYAPKLTDISGLSKLTKLVSVTFYNCTALKDLKALSTANFSKDYTLLIVGFSDNVKYAFTDYYFGARINVSTAHFWVEPASARCQGNSEKKLTSAADYAAELYSKVLPTVHVHYYNCKLQKDTLTGKK